MPKHMKRALLLLVAFAMLPALLYGCTEGAETSSGDPTTAQSGELPKNGNSVTVGIANDLDSLDPHTATSAGTTEVLFNLFEGLVKASPNGEIIPAVASDYTVSDDALTYTFTLREGVTFHNGAPVTMEDVLYSLERCRGSENDGTPLVTVFGNISNLKAEGNQLILTLNQPSLEFIYSMTAAIIPAGSGQTITSNPVGTGPFQFVSYAPQDNMVMKKYDGYWNQEKAAHLDQVTFRIFTDANALVLSLQGGTLDLAIHQSSSTASTLENNFTIHQDTMKLVQALYINNAVKPFDDLRVRQAMYYAINVPEIIDFVSDGSGRATGTSMYPAREKYFVEELATAYQQDIDKAKELLADAGYPNGFEMTITVPSNYTPHVRTSEIIAQQLQEVGITAKVELVEWGSWVKDIYRGRDFEGTVCAIAAEDMTAQEMLERYVTDHRKNFISFSNQEYDQVVNTALTTLDEKEQVAQYKRAQEILNEQAASLWIQDLCDLVVMSRNLDGFTFYSTYVLDMSTIYYK